MFGRLLPLAALLAALLLPATNDAGAVAVRVLSKSRLEISVEKTWNRLSVLGTLVDDRGAAIPAAELTLAVPGWGSRNALTDGGGRFQINLDAGDVEAILSALRSDDPDASEVELIVRYGGQSTLGAADARQLIDLSRETLQLQAVVTPPRLTLGEAPLVLAVLRHGTEPAVGLPLEARLGEQTATVPTGPDGRAVFRLFEPPPAGRHEVVVQFAGSERFNPVSVSREVLAIVRTTVTLERIDDATDPLRVRVGGVLRGGGEPMAGAVTLALDDVAYAHVDAGEDGRFEAEVDLWSAASRFGPSDSRLRAVYTAAEPWEAGSLSPSIEVAIPPPPRVPLPFYVVPLAVLLGAMLLAALIRSGQLMAWIGALRDLLRRAGQRRSSPAASAPAPLVEILPVPGGRRAPSSTRHVAGEVWDAHLEQPLPGAVLRVVGGDEATLARATTDTRGRFQLLDLSDGHHTLVIERAGFVPELLPIAVPHRGRMARVRLRLVPWRAMALEAYRELLATRLAGAARFGRNTPREVEALLRGSGGDTELVRAVTDRFEALYFGGDHRVTRAQHDEAVSLIGSLRDQEGAPT